MKRILITAVLVLVACTATAQNPHYFPNLAFDDNQQGNENRVQWYTNHLKALQEPSLLQDASSGKQAYRFLWLRSFHNPIAVRVDVNANGTSLLTVKVSNGQGGYEPGKLIKNSVIALSKDKTDSFLGHVDEVHFWNLPTREPKTDTVGVDGAEWIIESIKDGTYKVVDRWSPEKGPVRTLGLMMLIDLAKLKLLYQDVY